MGNFQNKLTLTSFDLEFGYGNTLKSEFTKLLGQLDSDLSENEEYFREDTLELGFEDEAERIVTDFIKSKGGESAIWEGIQEEEPAERMRELIQELFEFADESTDNGFYLESPTYVKEYDMMVQASGEDGDNEFQVIIAFIY